MNYQQPGLTEWLEQLQHREHAVAAVEEICALLNEPPNNGIPRLRVKRQDIRDILDRHGL